MEEIGDNDESRQMEDRFSFVSRKKIPFPSLLPGEARKRNACVYDAFPRGETRGKLWGPDYQKWATGRNEAGFLPVDRWSESRIHRIKRCAEARLKTILRNNNHNNNWNVSIDGKLDKKDLLVGDDFSADWENSKISCKLVSRRIMDNLCRVSSVQINFKSNLKLTNNAR